MTSLYSVDHKNYDSEKPIVSKISCFLTSYNGKLFYISEEKEIKTYDLNTGEAATLDSGKLECYAKLSQTDSRRFIWNSDKTAIYIKKRLETKPAILTKSGCSKKMVAPKKQLNNFSLLKIDLTTGKAQTALPELVDIMDIYGEYIFYTQSRDVTVTDKDKKGKSSSYTIPQTFFAAYDLKTGKSEDLLSENEYIVDAADGKVVYCKYSPVTFNMDLYVYNVAEKSSLLLEKNIYDSYKISNGKVLYTVGSYKRRSMFAISLDGKDRTEIMLNVEKIAFYDKNWMYVIKGYGYNTTLIKISYDGKKRVVVATGLERIIHWTSGYVYYVDRFGYLCMVRNDGKQKRQIIDNCKTAKIIVSSDCIFIMREESMDNAGKVVNTSLYRVDLQGHNLQKIYYGLRDMEEIDEQRIFFMQTERKSYKITTPQKKGDPIVSYTNSDVTTYYTYDKLTHNIQSMLVIGIPKKESIEFKSGCFGRKTTTLESRIEEIVKETGYTRTGKMTPGQIAEEDEEAEEEKGATATPAQNPLAAAQSALGKNLNISSLQGCSGCSSKK